MASAVPISCHGLYFSTPSPLVYGCPHLWSSDHTLFYLQNASVSVLPVTRVYISPGDICFRHPRLCILFAQSSIHAACLKFTVLF